MVHPFFDIIPDIDFTHKQIDVVITNFAGDDNRYDFDIVSGQKYYLRKSCSEKDVWKSYKGTIDLAPYHEGFVPRLLDQTKKPLKVIVYSNRLKKEEYLSTIDGLQGYSNSILLTKVRLVGGVIEQMCPNYPCDEPSKWTSRLVLLGVDVLDESLKNVYSFKNLSETVDYQYQKAFIENGQGRIIIDDIEYPGIKTYGQILPNDAMKFAIEKGHLFSNKEIINLRNTCEAMYLKMTEERKKIYDGDIDFVKYFSDFIKNDAANFFTCSEFVKFPEVTYDAATHWYFEFYKSFVVLNKMNFVYDCATRTWLRNYRVGNGKLALDQNKELLYCKNKSLNESFDRGVSLLSSLQKGSGEFYKYIEYDSGKDKTGNKIYAWVKSSGLKLTCEKNKDAFTLFPQDVVWPETPQSNEVKVEVYKKGSK